MGCPSVRSSLGGNLSGDFYKDLTVTVECWKIGGGVGEAVVKAAVKVEEASAGEETTKFLPLIYSCSKVETFAGQLSLTIVRNGFGRYEALRGAAEVGKTPGCKEVSCPCDKGIGGHVD